MWFLFASPANVLLRPETFLYLKDFTYPWGSAKSHTVSKIQYYYPAIKHANLELNHVFVSIKVLTVGAALHISQVISTATHEKNAS